MASKIIAGDLTNGLVVESSNDGTLVIQSGLAGNKVDALTISAVGQVTSNKPLGKVVQVVNATTSTTTTSTVNTYADTTLTATITPTSSNNKILVIVSQSGLGKITTNTYLNLILLRNATSILTFEVSVGYTASTAINYTGGAGCTFLDSPATTSAVTYKTQFKNNTATGTVYAQVDGGSSSITLIEVTP